LEDAEMCGNLMVKIREILIEGKSIKNTTPVQETEEDKEVSLAEEVSQYTADERLNSKGGCLGIIVIGIVLSSLIAFI
jgi:hypothetical protein